MHWSLTLGHFAGIAVRVHATFLIVLVWAAASEYWPEKSVSAGLEGLALIFAVFGSVLLHEFGHALTARRFGIRTRDIVLLPIGGVARMEGMPERPTEELFVAVAGPLVNVAIATICGVVVVLTGTELTLAAEVLSGSFLLRLLAINLGLAAFNMLPAFPMDGGRALRALLAIRLDRVRATRIAAAIGQGLALVFGLLGLLMGQPIPVFIALFVWLGAGAEADATVMKAALRGSGLPDIMITEFHVLRPEQPLATAAELLLAGFQVDFPVARGGAFVGMLTREDLVAGLTRAPSASVAGAMDADVAFVELSDTIDHALERLQGGKARTLPVVSRGRVVGLLQGENLAEYMMLREAVTRAETSGA